LSRREIALPQSRLSVQQLERVEAKRRLAGVLEIVNALGLEPGLVEEVGVARLELDVNQMAVGVALDGPAAVDADPEVGRPVAVEGNPVPGRELQLPDANVVVLEQQPRPTS
jgi:hypothetical protein